MDAEKERHLVADPLSKLMTASDRLTYGPKNGRVRSCLTICTGLGHASESRQLQQYNVQPWFNCGCWAKTYRSQFARFSNKRIVMLWSLTQLAVKREPTWRARSHMRGARLHWLGKRLCLSLRHAQIIFTAWPTEQKETRKHNFSNNQTVLFPPKDETRMPFYTPLLFPSPIKVLTLRQKWYFPRFMIRREHVLLIS